MYFDLATLRSMAGHLNQEVGDFKTRFGVQWDPEASSYVIEVTDGSGCPLLDGDACTVHPVKPVQCRSFPFWPEVVESLETWKAASAGCPGIDHPEGTWFSWAEVKRRARDA